MNYWDISPKILGSRTKKIFLHACLEVDLFFFGPKNLFLTRCIFLIRRIFLTTFFGLNFFLANKFLYSNFCFTKTFQSECQPDSIHGPVRPSACQELEIVVELRNNLALQKVFVALRYSKRLTAKQFCNFCENNFSCIEHISFCDKSLTATIFSVEMHKLFCFFEQFSIIWKVFAQNDAFLCQYNPPFRRNFSMKTFKFPETLFPGLRLSVCSSQLVTRRYSQVTL